MAENTVTVSQKGTIVIPKAIRDRYGICPGDQIHVLDWGQQIVLVKIPPGDPIEWGRGILKGGPSLTQELLEERRRELEREERGLPPPRAR
jgi:AbrB family looped-hinge helix DNA binding protein